MNTRLTMALSIAANLIFWPALFGFAALRPGYSHFTDAVSELGSFDAPQMWAWNIVGFVIPGLLLTLAGWRIGRAVEPDHYVMTTMLALSGAMLVLTGLAPADLSQRHGLATTIHLIGANGSLVAWAIALVMLASGIRGARKKAAIVALVVLACLAGILVLADRHALGLTQRLMFAAYFLSFPALALVALPRAP